MRTRRLTSFFALTGAWLALATCAPPEEGSQLASVTENISATQFRQPRDMPVVTLTNQHGEPFELRAEASGKVTLLYFGYTHCPDVCPITMSSVARALSRLEPEERARVLPVFVTLDPARDSPDRVGEWLGSMDSTFVGLTGTQEEVDDAAEQLGYVLPDQERPDSGWYEVAHPDVLFVFTPELLGRFGYHEGSATPDAIAADLRTLLAHDW
ncbi:MAG: SCO family protein [Gemmatimonadota bacterium]|nr:SCO family protein [Gemmatimonadota bacterium]